MNELVKELKDEIIEALNLEEMTADDIDVNEPLFGEDLLAFGRVSQLDTVLLFQQDYQLQSIN